MNIINAAERTCIKQLKFDGLFRDYITSSVDGAAPQLIGEVQWSLHMQLNFHAVTVGAAGGPTTAEIPAIIKSVPDAVPAAIAKYHLASPSSPQHTPVSTRIPIANDYFDTKKYWHSSDLPAGNNQAKTIIQALP